MIKDKQIIATGLIQPSNFDDLHSLQELVEAKKKIAAVEKNIEQITFNAVKSFILSGNEVLHYIPQNSKYELITAKYLDTNDVNLTLDQQLFQTVKDMDIKNFIVCNKSKTISPIWFNDETTKNINKHYVNRGHADFKYFKESHWTDNNKYFGFQKLVLNGSNIIVKYNLYYQSLQRVGGDGPWISTGGGRGYQMGSSLMHVTRSLTFTITIDVETNTISKIYMQDLD